MKNIFLLAGTASLVCLSMNACSDQTTEQQRPFAQDTVAGLFHNSISLMSDRDDDGSRPPSVIYPARDQFKLSFRNGKNSPCATFDSTAVLVDWDSLRAAINRVRVIPPDARGLKFHYGLRADGKYFQVGISIYGMKYLGGRKFDSTEPATADFYTISSDHTLQSGRKDDWIAVNGPGWNYRQYCKRYSGGVCTPLSATCDADSYVLTHEAGLYWLDADNNDTTGHRDIIIECIAIQDPATTECPDIEQRHHLSLTMRAGKKPLLNEIDYGALKYKRKALDLGTPCPPRCKEHIL